MLQQWHGTMAVWNRCARRGVVNVVREHDWLAAFGTLTGVFLLLQLTLTALAGMAGMRSLLLARAALHLEIQAEASDQQLQTFLSEVQQLSSVEQITYITKEQAYAQMKTREPDLVAFIEEFGMENPFPETVSVVLRSLGDYGTFRQFLQEERWRGVVDPSFLSEQTNQEAEIHELLSITRAAEIAVGILIAVIATTILFVTVELVRERVLRRAEEVLVEHLSGAFPWMIRLPFAIEAMVLLIVATAGSLLVCTLLIAAAGSMGTSLTAGGIVEELVRSTRNILLEKGWMIVVLELVAIPCIGFAGAWLGSIAKMNPRSLILHRH